MFSETEDLEKYFSTWFDIIPFSPDVEQLMADGNKSFLVLYPDGADAYADNYTDEDIIRLHENGCMFGLERG